jgi:predicted amidohydrolase
MKVAICQTNPVLLDVQTNIEDVISKINQCKKKGAGLIVFPELALTGYFVGANYHEVALKVDSPEIKRIAAVTKGTAAVVGFIEESSSMNFYNSALVAVDGEILFAYRKLNLPNYGVFEERKLFSNGKQVPVFKLYDFNVAVFICNDLWHPSIPYLGVTQKADIFITILNSSQGSMADGFSNIESWEIINKFYSRIFGIYNVCANRVGEEGLDARRLPDEKKEKETEEKQPDMDDIFLEPKTCKTYKFWGGSEIINPFGLQIKKAKLYKEDIITSEISKDLLRKKKIMLPYLRNDDPYFTHRELDRILFGKKEDLSVVKE